MAYVAVDKNSEEWIFTDEPIRGRKIWANPCESVQLPKGTIEKLIGKKLTWEDEPIELKEEK